MIQRKITNQENVGKGLLFQQFPYVNDLCKIKIERFFPSLVYLENRTYF